MEDALKSIALPEPSSILQAGVLLVKKEKELMWHTRYCILSGQHIYVSKNKEVRSSNN
jgi:hypothetical protein